MANRPAQIRQSDAARIFKAAATAGYGRTRLIIHPDGVIEYVAETVETAKKSPAANDWDEVLK